MPLSLIIQNNIETYFVIKLCFSIVHGKILSLLSILYNCFCYSLTTLVALKIIYFLLKIPNNCILFAFFSLKNFAKRNIVSKRNIPVHQVQVLVSCSFQCMTKSTTIKKIIIIKKKRNILVYPIASSFYFSKEKDSFNSLDFFPKY